MDKHISSDKPIALQEEDKFQRYNFSQRIAKTIIDRENEDCIVIGIYGAWGEGKTSVINFIETELKQNDEIIVIKFNPWRYNDENSLLLQFFQKLASSLDSNLKTKKEKAGELLHKYGKLLKIDIPFIGNIGETIQSAGEMLSEVDVEILKSRIGEIIKENEKKIVVFIDDIDRLDKTEIHSIFRLVKLTADFSNTTYVLSFDEVMVSSAIGERFGEGNQKAGQSFLEKIIQVPLKIPVAQPDALKQFCFELIDKSLNSNGISISESEVRRFVSAFTDGILFKLDTPRLAVRYGNTLSFALPLLDGEVNIVDLMLIEAVKIFFPLFYDFIKSNSEYFIGTYSDKFSNGRDNEKIKQIKEHFEILSKDLTRRQAKGIQNLLEELFPKLEEAFQNRSYTSGTEQDWFKNKRIVSPKYFSRYFSYAVIKGEVSDVGFQNMISSVPSQQGNETVESIKELVNLSSPENFLQKIRVYEEDFPWQTSVKLAKAISKCTDLFPSKSNDFFTMGIGSPNSQAAIFIYQLIKKHENKEEGFELAKDLTKTAEPFEFAFELNKWFRSGDFEVNQIFKSEQYAELSNALLERAINEANGEPLFLKFPNLSNYLYSTWAEKDKDGLSKYIEELFVSDPTKSIELLNSFTPIMRSSAYPEPYQSNFSDKQFEYFISVFDKELVKKYLLLNYTEEQINNGDIIWEEHRGKYQDNLNIVRQFMHWDKLTQEKTTET